MPADMRGQLELFVRDAVDGRLTLSEIECNLRREFLVQQLERHEYNVCETARAVGMHRNSLSRNCHDLHINLDAGRAARKQPKSQSLRAESESRIV